MRFRVLLASVSPQHADRLCTYAIYIRVLRVGSASALRCGPLVAEPLGLASRCCLLPEHPVIRQQRVVPNRSASCTGGRSYMNMNMDMNMNMNMRHEHET